MLEKFNSIFQSFNGVLNDGYEVLLEADIMGWIFFLVMNNSGIKTDEVHLNARVLGLSGFYDIAIGKIDNSQKRPCIDPVCLIEIKCFPMRGFTDQQNRVHYEHILDDDLKKLGMANNDVLTFEIVFDGKDYLSGTYYNENRLQHLINKRTVAAPNAKLVIIRKMGNQWKHTYY